MNGAGYGLQGASRKRAELRSPAFYAWGVVTSVLRVSHVSIHGSAHARASDRASAGAYDYAWYQQAGVHALCECAFRRDDGDGHVRARGAAGCSWAPADAPPDAIVGGC